MKVSGSLAMIGSVLPRYCHSSCSAISRGYRRNVLEGTATVAVQANRSKGTATVVVRYREDTAGKPGWYREGIARTSPPPASSSRTDPPKFFVLAGARAPAHEIGANTNLKINKDCSKIIIFFVRRFIRVLLLLDKWMAIARRACLCMV